MNIVKRLLSISIIVLSFMLFSIGVMASNEVKAYTDFPKGESQIIQGICNASNAEVGGKEVLKCELGTSRLCFNNAVYVGLNSSEKQRFMEVSLATVKSSGLGVKTKNSIYNFIANQDSATSAAIRYLSEDASTDFTLALKWVRPFSGKIGMAFGLVSLTIFLFLGIGLVMDIAYLVLPGVQLILERGEENKRPIGVSNEAWKVNREIEKNVHNNKGVLSEYLKKRIPVLIVVSICLSYLISGKIYDLFTIFA